jgi:nitroreductase
MLEFLRAPRATRVFDPKPIEQEEIEAIIEVARWSGSARNRQPWRFVSVTNRSVQERLSRLGAYAQHLAAAPAVLVLLSIDEEGWIDTEFDMGRVAQLVSLAAHAIGLGSCVATFYPDENVSTAARLVGAPAGWKPHHAISIGHPAEDIDGRRPAIPKGRLPMNLLLTHLSEAGMTGPE